MPSLNKCLFIGNLGKDPEVRYMQDGTCVANASIGVNEPWKDKNGEKKESTEWVRVSFFGKLAEVVAQYLKKGAPVFVEGRMRTRKWQGKDGKDNYSTEIIASSMQMLGGRGSGGNERDSTARASATSGDRQTDFDNAPPDFDDDIQF